MLQPCVDEEAVKHRDGKGSDKRIIKPVGTWESGGPGWEQRRDRRCDLQTNRRKGFGFKRFEVPGE